MKSIVVVTGASSGFGLMAAQALAHAGHTVYASMRETTGRNAPQAEAVRKFAKDQGVDLRPIELDVSSQESVDRAIENIVAENGRPHRSLAGRCRDRQRGRRPGTRRAASPDRTGGCVAG
jgi:NAD(P)-dependent dehydrogenase (short-subunit alcohol dehydrogenase family)